MLRTIELCGSLKDFGGPFVFDVKTVQEAVHALTVQIHGLTAAIRGGEFLVYADKAQLEESETAFDLGQTRHIRIVPVPVGSKNNGVFKVILGAALLGVGLAAAGGALGHAGAFLGIAKSTWITMGAGMMLNGIGQMISPSPVMTTGDSEKSDSKTSYLFNSAVNVCEEGNCVPVVYGTAYCGSLVISSGYSVDDVDIALDNVSGLTLKGGAESIKAQWNAVKGAYDYEIRWTGPVSGSKTTDKTSGTENDLPAGEYTVSVRARSGSVTSKNWTSAKTTVKESTTSEGDGPGDGDN